MAGGAALSPPQAAALADLLQRLTTPPEDPPVPARPAPLATLVDCIAAKPWRRSALDPESRADLVAKVTAARDADRPIRFALPFAGCKGWRAASFPDPDWAEVFWVDHLRSYAGRIARLHPPGVEIAFSHASGAVEWMNNLPAGTQARYIAGFEALLALRSSPRLRLRTEDHAAACGGGAALVRLLEARLEGGPTPGAAECASAARNLRPDAPDRRPDARAVALAARRCAELMGHPPRRAFNKDGPRIQITHIRGATRALHLASTRASVAQPWVASGHLAWHAGRGCWLERLVTATQDAPALCHLPVAHPLADRLPALARLPVAPAA